MLTGGLAGALVLGALGATAAEARPTKPSPVPGLTAKVVAHPGDTYDVTASWSAVANATGYKATVSKGGSVLTSVTVTTPTWSPTLSTTPGSATLSVRAVVGHRAGKPSSVPLTLPDVTKPTGTFAAASDNASGTATITQDSLNDDSGTADVTRTVDWGDGTAPESWTSGTVITHQYRLTPDQEVRFAATVTLEDAAHNTATVAVAPAPVFNDHTAPTGAFTAGPASAWAGLTDVTVTQTALSDDRTPSQYITRSIDWGDGDPAQTWTGGTTLTHVYLTGGTFAPVVTATDEAGNSARFTLSAVTVTVDSTAPVVKLILPRHRHSVRAWRTLRGRATDTAGTGVGRVHVRAVEKRSGHWYGYRPASRRWVAAATKAGAFSKARPFSLATNSRHRWVATLAGLKKGTLVYRVTATDLVGNTSKPLGHTAHLTRR